MPQISYTQLGAMLGTVVVVVGLLSPTLERIDRLETSAEVLNVKLTAIVEGLERLSRTLDTLTTQERGRGPGTPP